MPDCDLDQAVNGLMGAAYGSAGERCMAQSVAVAVGKIADPLVKNLSKKVESLKVGPGLDKKSQMGPLVTKQHLELMTDLVRQIREEVLEASSRRGKAILLSVRILPTLNQNRYFGFDIQNWVKQGYVDLIVVGGGYDPFTMPAKDMIDHGHQWGVPVYVCLSSSGFTHTIADGRFFSTDTSQWNQSSAQASDLVALQSWRAAAANAWFSGADGIMTFNLFPKYPGSRATTMARQVWKEIGDPKKLRYQDKLYAIDNLKDMKIGFMMGSVPVNDRLPIEIKKGVLAQCILPIADDLAANEEDLKSLDIRLKLTGFTGNEAITVKINKEQLNLKKGESDWLIGEIPAGEIHRSFGCVVQLDEFFGGRLVLRFVVDFVDDDPGIESCGKEQPAGGQKTEERTIDFRHFECSLSEWAARGWRTRPGSFFKSRIFRQEKTLKPSDAGDRRTVYFTEYPGG